MLEPLLAGEARVVFGTRAWTSQASFSFWYVIGNKCGDVRRQPPLQLLAVGPDDVPQGDGDRVVPVARATGGGFAVEPEITARVLLAGERIYEVPVAYRARTREEGKKLTAFDGLRVLRTLVRCRIDPHRRPRV